MSPSNQIRFYEDERLVRTMDAAELPDNVRYVELGGTRVEVAKVIAVTSGETQSIEQYSASGELLRRTVQVLDPPGRAL